MAKKLEGEVAALATAYKAITSQPPEAWPRMIEWLDARVASDLAHAAAERADEADRG